MTKKTKTIQATINQQTVRVNPGTTILEAARLAGIHIPSLCYRKDLGPLTSCMVCIVEIRGFENLVPACTAPTEDGMVIETESDRILTARRTALELLLSEHTGDCIAPCQKACPFHIDIPSMIRRIQQGDPAAASHVVSVALSGPETGCERQCEKACRRNRYDEAVAIRRLGGFLTNDTGCPGILKGAVGDQDSDNHGPDDGRRFNSVMRKITEDELDIFIRNSGREKQVRPKNPGTGYDVSEARRESLRCLHCDCRNKDGCSLRECAGIFQAQQTRYPGERTGFEQHVFKDYIFEPGKCIQCGICTRISEQKGLPYGFSFLKRGFDTRVGVPFNRFENPELLKIIGLLVENCPTGALVANDGT